MAHWNHRVVKEKYDNGEEYYSIRECHYNDDGSIYAYSAEARPAYGETLEDLRWTLEHMLKSLDAPVLIDGEVKFVDPYKNEDFEEGTYEEDDEEE